MEVYVKHGWAILWWFSVLRNWMANLCPFYHPNWVLMYDIYIDEKYKNLFAQKPPLGNVECCSLFQTARYYCCWLNRVQVRLLHVDERITPFLECLQQYIHLNFKIHRQPFHHLSLQIMFMYSLDYKLNVSFLNYL